MKRKGTKDWWKRARTYDPRKVKLLFKGEELKFFDGDDFFTPEPPSWFRDWEDDED